MIKIAFSPRRQKGRLTLSAMGDVLTINGVAYDLSVIPDGATLPKLAVTCDWLASDVERIDGDLHLKLVLPHGRYAPQATLFPGPITVTEDGPIPVPPPIEESL